MKYAYGAALLGALASTASAHTWVEQLMVVAPNGTMVGQPGFARGNVQRSSAGFSDPTMVNLIPPNPRPVNQIFDTDLMCKDSQTTQTNTNGSPRLQAAAGANVALRYQENGHVTLPQNQPGKPDNRGTVFVYGTTQPSADDKFLSIHRVWNAAGTGGDKRGVLLSTQNFDDSQCYQVNSGQISTTRQKTFAHASTQLMGADLWCQQDIQIPATAPSGKPYTLYWVWDWPTMPGTAGFPDGKQEIYTTCIDVDVVASSGGQSKVVSNSFAQGQDLGSAAASAELADIANPTAVIGQSIAFSAASGTPAATDNSGFTSYATETSSVATSMTATAASVVTGSLTATNSPTATSSATNANSGQQTQSQSTRTRVSVSPIGASSATPFAQSTAGVSNNGDGNNHSSGARSRPQSTHTTGGSFATNQNSVQNSASATQSSNVLAAQNTGTAITQSAASVSTTTATVSGLTATVTRFQTYSQMFTQTKTETVSPTGNAKRAFTVTAAPSESLSIQSTDVPCSKRHAAYKLRARSPFYVTPIDSGDSY